MMVEEPDQAGSIEERMSKASAYATAMANLFLSARQKLAIMEPLLGEEISNRFNDSYGAHAYRALTLTLNLDLMRDIWAFTLDPNKHAPSLKNVWRLVENKELHAALRAVAATPYKGGATFSGDGWSEDEKAQWRARWDKEDIETRGRAFDKAFKRTSVALPELVASELAGKLDRARKKAIAHYDMMVTKDGPKLFPLADIGLKWGDPKAFLDQIDQVLWDVVLLATWGSYDVKGFEQRSRLYAADFWARLQGKPPVENIKEL
jgi:AbiU2